MGLSGRKLADIISALIRVQKLSMPGTGGEPAGSLFYPKERRMLALYRNACAHDERLFSHRCHVEILDTALHAKLGIEKIGPDYACGKVDVFSAVIAHRYLLRDDEFKAFKAKLVKCVNGYLSSTRASAKSASLKPWVSRPNGVCWMQNWDPPGSGASFLSFSRLVWRS